MLRSTTVLRFITGIVVSLVLAAQATAQATRPAADTPDEAAARAAAKAFVLALGEADATKARALFAGSAEDAKAVDQMHGAFTRLGRLAAAVEKRWPDAQNFKPDTPAGRAASVDRASIKLAGDHATFPEGPLLQKIDGRWRVIDVFIDPPSKRTGQRMLADISAVVDETLPEIEQGKYATAADVEKALGGRMMKRMQERLALPATTTTRPAR